MTQPTDIDAAELSPNTPSAGAREGSAVPSVMSYASTMLVEDKTVVYDEDAHTMLVLNSSAGAVWSLCDGWRTVASIVTELAGLHGTDPDQIEDDVWDTVEKLTALGVLSDARRAQPPG